MATPIRVCVQISRKSSAGKCVKRCVVSMTKVRKMHFFGAIYVRSAPGARSFQVSVTYDPTSPCKISSQSVPICQSYSRKKSFRVRSQYMPSVKKRIQRIQSSDESIRHSRSSLIRSGDKGGSKENSCSPYRGWQLGVLPPKIRDI